MARMKSRETAHLYLGESSWSLCPTWVRSCSVTREEIYRETRDKNATPTRHYTGLFTQHGVCVWEIFFFLCHVSNWGYIMAKTFPADITTTLFINKEINELLYKHVGQKLQHFWWWQLLINIIQGIFWVKTVCVECCDSSIMPSNYVCSQHSGIS